uniref:Uncharacterized protein n=1 Tax=Arundo donax TaxID=35708 RepID=A0A0A8ZXA7_ARUDO
MTYCTPRRQ